MKKLILILPVFVAACSSGDTYQAYSQASQKRMETIAEISRQGEGGVVAAALLMERQGVARPTSVADTALKWAQVLVPGAVSIAQINSNKDLGIVRSNNSTTVALDTNSTMATIAEATIVDPVIVEQPDPVIVDPVVVEQVNE